MLSVPFLLVRLRPQGNRYIYLLQVTQQHLSGGVIVAFKREDVVVRRDRYFKMPIFIGVNLCFCAFDAHTGVERGRFFPHYVAAAAEVYFADGRAGGLRLHLLEQGRAKKAEGKQYVSHRKYGWVNDEH